MAYDSAVAKTKEKQNRLQGQALRIWCGSLPRRARATEITRRLASWRTAGRTSTPRTSQTGDLSTRTSRRSSTPSTLPPYLEYNSKQHRESNSRRRRSQATHIWSRSSDRSQIWWRHIGRRPGVMKRLARSIVIFNQMSATRSSTASNLDARTQRSHANVHGTAWWTQVYTRSECETTPTEQSVEHRIQQNTFCSPVQSNNSFKTMCAATASGSTNRTTSRPCSEQQPAQTSSTAGTYHVSINCKHPYSSLDDFATFIFIIKKRSVP